MSEEQRRSFAYGNTNIDNPNVTREMVDAAADRLTELPPIIERLDAERDTILSNKHGFEWADMQWKRRVGENYDDLRAELLRLQEERSALENDVSLLAKALHDSGNERTALLEALKGSIEAMEYELEHTCDDDGPDDPCLGYAGLLEALPKARSAIDHVEGKDG